MRVSIILSSLNEEKFARQFFESLSKQTRKAEEIILIDSSTDRTPEIAKPHVTELVCMPTKNLSQARKIGVEMSTGNVIVLTDIDTILDKGWLENLIKPMENPKVSVVQGHVLAHGWNEENTMFSRGLRDGIGYVNHCNIAYRRHVLEEFPFDDKLMDMDDCEMGYRVTRRYRLYAARDAKVWHVGSAPHEGGNVEKYRRNINRWAVGYVQCLLKHRNLHWFARPWYNIVNAVRLGLFGHAFRLSAKLLRAYYTVTIKNIIKGKGYEA